MPLIDILFSTSDPHDGGMPWLDHGYNVEHTIGQGHGPWFAVTIDCNI